jgi:ABC-type nitrate/sulfonate/bicarbonate transport system, ATPase component
MPTMTTHDTSAPVAPSSAPGPEVPRLHITDLGRDFTTRSGVTHAVSGIDLDIRVGEFVALIGRSGCGKTTLLRMIGGLLSPTTGTIEVDGRSLWRGTQVDPMAVTKLGFVFQESNLFPWFSVLDNIALPMKLRGVRKAERRARAADLAALVGLTGFEKSYPRELSGGMRQRAAIARALSTEPELLLMDEPFAALDEITRFRLNDDLLELWASQRWTVVFVTHSVFESVYLSTRILVMGARPGSVRSEVMLEARRDASFRNSAEYAEQCRTVSARLAEAMQA